MGVCSSKKNDYYKDIEEPKQPQTDWSVEETLNYLKDIIFNQDLNRKIIDGYIRSYIDDDIETIPNYIMNTINSWYYVIGMKKSDKLIKLHNACNQLVHLAQAEDNDEDNDECIAKILQSNGLDIVFRIMQNTVIESDIQERIVSVVYVICKNSAALKQHPATVNGIYQICGGLRSNLSNLEFVKLAFGAIHHFCIDNIDVHITMVLETNVIEQIICGMNYYRHRDDTYSVYDAGCRALGSIGQQTEGKKAVGTKGVKAIIDGMISMKEYKSKKDIAESSMATLYWLCQSPQNLRSFIINGGVPLLDSVYGVGGADAKSDNNIYEGFKFLFFHLPSFDEEKEKQKQKESITAVYTSNYRYYDADKSEHYNRKQTVKTAKKEKAPDPDETALANFLMQKEAELLDAYYSDQEKKLKFIEAFYSELNFINLVCELSDDYEENEIIKRVKLEIEKRDISTIKLYPLYRKDPEKFIRGALVSLSDTEIPQHDENGQYIHWGKRCGECEKYIVGRMQICKKCGNLCPLCSNKHRHQTKVFKSDRERFDEKQEMRRKKEEEERMAWINSFGDGYDE